MSNVICQLHKRHLQNLAQFLALIRQKFGNNAPIRPQVYPFSAAEGTQDPIMADIPEGLEGHTT